MIRSRVKFCFSPALMAEIASINRMGSASLREATEALMMNKFSPRESEAIIKAVFDRALAIRSDMRHWDLVALIQANAFSTVNGAESVASESLGEISEIVRGKLSHLSPKHMIDLIAAVEVVAVPQPDLYRDLFHRLIDSVRSSMYADELVALLRVLSRHKVNNAKLVDALSSSLQNNESLMNQLRLLHCCEVAGGFAALGRLPKHLADSLQARVEKELTVMPMEELWKSVTGVEQLVHSYRPFEEMASAKIQKMISELEPVVFDQVSRPMDFLQFIRFRGWLSQEVILAACKWANDAVYRPATRTQAHRRPTIFEVTLLADLSREYDVPLERIEKAVTVTVTSKGGTVDRIAKPKPLRYRRRRAYIAEPDEYAEARVVPLKSLPEETQSVKKSNEAAFAPRLRAQTNEPLWKARSGHWFTRK